MAEKIDEALLEYQHRVATHEGLNSPTAETVAVEWLKFGKDWLDFNKGGKDISKSKRSHYS